MKTGYQKRIISKTLSSVEMFDRLAVLLWEDKTKVFENDTSRSWIPVNAHAPIKDATVYSWMLVWTDKTNSKTQRVDADFLENGEKISKFKQNRIRKVGALEHWHKNFLTNEMIFLHKIPLSPGAYIFQRSFLRGLYKEGNLRFKIGLLILGGKYAPQNPLGWLIVGRKFTLVIFYWNSP